MARLIIIIVSALAVFYFFGDITPPSGNGAGSSAPPPSRLPVPKETAQIVAKPAVESQKPGFRTFHYKLALPGQQTPQEITFDIPDDAFADAGKEMPLFNSAQIKQILAQDAERLRRELDLDKAAREQQVVNIINRDVLMKNGVTMVLEDHRGKKSMRFQYWQTHQNKQTLGYLKETVKQKFKEYDPYVMMTERSHFTARQTQYLSQYLPNTYYVYDIDFDFKTQGFVGYLRPDFARIAADQRENIYSLAQAIFKATPVKDPRNLAAMALYFVQAIPVSPRDSQRNLLYRDTPFVTPTTMLLKNRGSADTKATALASLLGILLPDYTVVMYLLPEHAVIGVNLQPQPNDFIHRSPMGHQFVIMEPFGPNLMPIGQVQDYTRKVIDNSVYSYFAVPQ